MSRQNRKCKVYTHLEYGDEEFRGQVSLRVFNISGRCIKTLENGVKDAGVYRTRWNGFDNNNKKISAGVYFTRLSSGEFTSTKKVILVR